MPEKERTKKNDFVEIEFVGKANGETFDTTIKEEAEKINLKIEAKPLIVCIGQGMLVKGFDKELEGKEIGKKYKIKLSPEESFGKRNPALIKIFPLKVFREKNTNPVPGLMLNFDGLLAKIITVSGGRVITDFNNPLSGKDIEYEFTIKREVADEKEKINSVQDFFFKKIFDFKIEEKKVVFSKEAIPFLQLFGSRIKEILGKEIEAESSLGKTSEKTAEANALHMTEGKEKKEVKSKEEKPSKKDPKKEKN